MKKITAMLLTVLMLVSLAACGGEEEPAEESASGAGNTTGTISGESVSTENDPAGAISGENVSTENNPTENMQPEATPEPESNGGASEMTSENEPKILVAYFSATNTTEGVARKIADGLSADIYEIVPEQPYTDADLDYHDNNSRSTIEMNDPSSRPAISGSVEDMEQYSIVFIGYPIWWGEAPRIVSTFVESYDLSGKTIVPFCTSGGSGVGSSATNLEELTSGATWMKGHRLNGSDSQETVMEWVNSLGLDLGE